MSKHTPGPWIQQKYGKPANPYIIAQTCAYPSPSTTVAWGTPTGGQGWPAVGANGVFDRETVEANARLIAAAPDLLAACELASVEFGKRDVFLLPAEQTVLKVIMSAIAKATATE